MMLDSLEDVKYFERLNECSTLQLHYNVQNVLQWDFSDSEQSEECIKYVW